MTAQQNNPDNTENMPLPLLFLKIIVGALGVVLVAGFVFVIGILLLGGKYFTEQVEFEPYKLAKKVELSPAVIGKIISVKTSPVGVEVLSQDDNGKITLTIYNGKTGQEFSKVRVN